MKKLINRSKRGVNVSHETSKPLKKFVLLTISVILLSACARAAGVGFVCDVEKNGEYVFTAPCAEVGRIVKEGAESAAEKCGVPDSEIEILESAFESVRYRVALCADADRETAVRKVAQMCGETEVRAYSLYVDGEYTASCGSKAEIENAVKKTESVCEKLDAVIGNGEKTGESGIDGVGETKILCEYVRADRLVSGRETEKILGCDRAERELELIAEYAGAVKIEMTEDGAEFTSESEVFAPSLKLSSRSGGEYIETVEEVIAHGTEYVSTDELAVGTQRLHTRGSDGTARVVYLVSRLGDGSVKRTAIDSEVLTEPQKNVVYMGTNRGGEGYPERYGRFICPCEGTVTSGYGERELFGEVKLHGGLDIGAPEGTAVYAADEGVVEYAGDCGNGYGIHVIVDHGGGIKTLYGHMRSVSVGEGDEVLQGEKLGEVGLTGKTTGFHLHFEIRYDGARLDPLLYIKARA